MPTESDYHGASVSNSFALQLDGEHCCWLHRSFGGGIYADIASQPGSGHHWEKLVGSPQYEDLVLDLGLPLHPKMVAWISSSWKMEHRRLNGSIIFFDLAGAVTERKFTHAVLGAITIPNLQLDSADIGFLRVSLAPERFELHRRPKLQMPPADTFAHSPLRPSNFKLTIDGLNCEDVYRIEPFTIRQAVHRHAVGEEPGTHQLEAGRVEFPRLILTLYDRASANGWYDWLNSFVVGGKNGGAQMKKGVLALHPTDPQLKVTEIHLVNLGMGGMTEPEFAAEQEVHLIRVELFCERMELLVPA